MSKPYIHAQSSVRRWGGEVEDYLPIHNLMDSSKGAIADNRHRVLTHNAWFLSTILEQVFGVTISISVCSACSKRYNAKHVIEGVCRAGDNGEHYYVPKRVSTRDVGEQHVLEDYGGKFIPSAQDFLEKVPMEPWMNNGKEGSPPSFRALDNGQQRKRRVIRFDND